MTPSILLDLLPVVKITHHTDKLVVSHEMKERTAHWVNCQDEASICILQCPEFWGKSHISVLNKNIVYANESVESHMRERGAGQYTLHLEQVGSVRFQGSSGVIKKMDRGIKQMLLAGTWSV